MTALGAVRGYRGGVSEAGRNDDDEPDTAWERLEEEVEEVSERLVEGYEEAIDRVLPPHLRARAWARRRRSTHKIWQASVLVLGFALVVAGIAMLVLPGPGWATIILGLIVLASEYAWARRLLEPVRRWAKKAADAALDPRVRRRNLIIGGALLAVVVVACAWYVSAFGLTLGPVTGLIPG